MRSALLTLASPHSYHPRGSAASSIKTPQAGHQCTTQYTSQWVSPLGTFPPQLAQVDTQEEQIGRVLDLSLASMRCFTVSERRHPGDTVMRCLHIPLHFTSSQSPLFKETATHMTNPWPFLEAMLSSPSLHFPSGTTSPRDSHSIKAEVALLFYQITFITLSCYH